MKKLLILYIATLSLMGCTQLKKLTGGTESPNPNNANVAGSWYTGVQFNSNSYPLFLYITGANQNLHGQLSINNGHPFEGSVFNSFLDGEVSGQNVHMVIHHCGTDYSFDGSVSGNVLTGRLRGMSSGSQCYDGTMDMAMIITRSPNGIIP